MTTPEAERISELEAQLLGVLQRETAAVYRHDAKVEKLEKRIAELEASLPVVDVPCKYGNRNIVKMYAQINTLRSAILAEGTPDIQDAWDAVENHIDFVYGNPKITKTALAESRKS